MEPPGRYYVSSPSSSSLQQVPSHRAQPAFHEDIHIETASIGRAVEEIPLERFHTGPSMVIPSAGQHQMSGPPSLWADGYSRSILEREHALLHRADVLASEAQAQATAWEQRSALFHREVEGCANVSIGGSIMEEQLRNHAEEACRQELIMQQAANAAALSALYARRELQRFSPSQSATRRMADTANLHSQMLRNQEEAEISLHSAEQRIADLELLVHRLEHESAVREQFYQHCGQQTHALHDCLLREEHARVAAESTSVALAMSSDQERVGRLAAEDKVGELGSAVQAERTARCVWARASLLRLEL
eukprot:NODE_743_length_1937_cov_43.617585_g688_i0.p1 GENE.NODE_743_length_1937_cov_43.617585_g688_i0~~NODE_743_length_1937_cov_43.617585_g688_i0.p1  ORF type:complete len:307 (+),score=62.16 NODE_743_length_1937_cov_43.617585_g688_i0:101-1021(+)